MVASYALSVTLNLSDSLQDMALLVIQDESQALESLFSQYLVTGCSATAQAAQPLCGVCGQPNRRIAVWCHAACSRSQRPQVPSGMGPDLLPSQLQLS